MTALVLQPSVLALSVRSRRHADYHQSPTFQVDGNRGLATSELRELHRTLKGNARFSSYEGQIELALVGDGLGHVAVHGEAMDIAGTGNMLRFHFEIDQTEPQPLLHDLEAIVARHPARVA